MKNIESYIEKAVRILCEYMPNDDELSKPTLLHGIRTGVYLYENGYGQDIVLAGLLHDIIEDTEAMSELYRIIKPNGRCIIQTPFRKGEIYEDWAELFEEMPGRFIVGTDVKFGRKRWPVSRYNKTIELLRKMLATLDPKAAEKVAYHNARKLFQ